MHQVVHLIPYDGIGGVETAARSIGEYQPDDLEFRVRCIFDDVPEHRIKWKTYNPFQIISCARSIATESPDLLIMSLWRAALVGILVRFLNPRVRLVLMVHNSVDAHLLDYTFTRWVMTYCAEIWADSTASVVQRFDKPPSTPVHTISFPGTSTERASPHPTSADIYILGTTVRPKKPGSSYLDF